ncbi:MAG: orotate phosphoribosyltransferase [Sporichthyaceae bacterium]
MSSLRERTIEIVRKRGLIHRPEGFVLASGELSYDYMDGKRALARGQDLHTACAAIIDLATTQGAEWDAVGGLTLGADCFAHGVAMIAGKEWFVVRKAAKTHGKGQQIEGAKLGPGVRVLLVDDVVSSGGSILQSLDVVEAAGAQVVLATTLVDRGEVAAPEFARRGVPYAPLMTYADLDIDPIGGR